MPYRNYKVRSRHPREGLAIYWTNRAARSAINQLLGVMSRRWHGECGNWRKNDHDVVTAVSGVCYAGNGGRRATLVCIACGVEKG